LPLMDSLRAAGHLVEAFDLPGMGDDHTSASDRLNRILRS
jgi:hypothetical protein